MSVLVYHRFAQSESGTNTVKTATLQAQLRSLSSHGYRIVPLRSALDCLSGGVSPYPLMVAITADDGHRSVYSEMFPIIKEERIPVTLFVYPSAISRVPYALTWEQLLEMQSSGLIDIESHTYWHPDFRREKRRLSPEQYASFIAFQLTRSKEVLEQKLHHRVDFLAWPFGVSDSDLKRAAAKAGYIGAFAYSGGEINEHSDRFALPRVPVSEQDRGRAFEVLLRRKIESKSP